MAPSETASMARWLTVGRGAGIGATFAPTPVHITAIEWIFRVAVAMEFVGHGVFGVKTKAVWLPYFAVVGIPDRWAWHLMPLIGALDISLGLLTLVLPLRAVLLHMSCWGFITASLRPLAGEGVSELIERGYNYGVPFAFLLLAGIPTAPRAWFTRIDFSLTRERRRLVSLTLRWAIALALVGHGGIALFAHQKWIVYLEPLGLDPASPRALAWLRAVGWFELMLGLSVLAAPLDALLLFVFVWKVLTEGLRLAVGEPIWEFVERGGAYAAPVILILVKSCSKEAGGERP